MRLTLVNPNTSEETTRAMVAIATQAAGFPVRGLTAPFGTPLITEPHALERAAEAVVALADRLAHSDAVVIAAFGDPGLVALRTRLRCPVTGLAEAGMAEAAVLDPRFAVATTTPALAETIAERARTYGHAGFVGTFSTPGAPEILMSDPQALERALDDACRRAIAAGAGAIVIGGGPLAQAARALAGRLPVPLVEPVPAAIRLSLARFAQSRLSETTR